MALSQKRTRLIQLPLTNGQREDIDPKLASLFDGNPILKQAKNLRLRKDGRLGVRNGISAVGVNTVTSGSFLAYDLLNFNDRLFAIGTNNSDGAPCQLWEYQTGLSGADWTNYNDFLRVSVGQNPGVNELASFGGEASVFGADCAASNGYVAVIYSTTDQPTTCLIRVYRTSTKALLFTFLLTNLEKPQVVAVDSTGTFMFVGIDASDNSVPLYRFNPTTDVFYTTLTDLYAAGGSAITALAIARVAGTSNLIAVMDRGSSADAVIHRVNTSGSTVGSDINIASTDSQHLAIESNNTNANVIIVASGAATLRTYVLASGSLANGPTSLFGGDILNGPPSIVRRTSTTLVAAGYATEGDTNDTVKLDSITESSHTINEAKIWYGTSLGSRLMVKPTGGLTSPGVYFTGTSGWFSGVLSRSNNFNLYTAVGDHSLVQEFVLDQQFATLKDGSVPLQGGAVDPVSELAYWVSLRKSDLDSSVGVLYEAPLATTVRRQSTPFGGQLFLASGTIQAFDGTNLTECGFQDIPEIRSVAQSTSSGQLTLLGTYQYAIVFRYIGADGRVVRSAPSEILTTTLTGSNNTITLTVNTPHSQRTVGSGLLQNVITIEVYRSATGGELLRLAGEFPFEITESSYGVHVDVTDVKADSQIATNNFIYTQGDQGAQSGLLENNPPEPGTLIAAGRDILAIAGLPDRSTFEVSKQLFPNEALGWSQDEAFFGTVGDEIVGIHFLDERLYIFTKTSIYQAIGDGPSDAGDEESQSIGVPQLMSATYGLVDISNTHSEWRSIVEDRDGLWFQGTRDKILRIGRGGGEPEWLSRPVQDVLASFPVVCAASYIPDDYSTSWLLQATDGLSSRIITRDSRTESWFVDQYSTVFKSAVKYQGKLALLSTSGTVFLQNSGFSDNGSFISTTLETNTMYIGGPGGWGHIVSVHFKGEYRGDCVLTFSISYDDGKTYTASTSLDITAAAGYTAGQTVDKVWYPARRKCEGFRVKFDITEKSGSGPTEGLAINELTFEVMDQRGSSRRNPADVR